jgi:hypothetical protein
MILRVMAVLLCGGRVPVSATATLPSLAFWPASVRQQPAAAGGQAGSKRSPRRWRQSPCPAAARSPPAMTVAQITPPAQRTDALAAHAYGLPVVRELPVLVADPAADRSW